MLEDVKRFLKTAGQSPSRPGRLELVSFVTGFALLAYELAAARVLAPSIGSSTYVWTSVIGVIIAALAVGFFAGGRLADIRSNRSDVSWLLIAAAAASLYTLLSYESNLAAIVQQFDDPRVQGVWAALTLFAPTSFLIGMTSPYLSKLRVGSLSATGRSIASLDAFNSLGGITGTFVTGFVLFGFVGSRVTFILVTVLLLAAAWVMATRSRLGLRIAFTVALLLMALAPPMSRAGAIELDTASAHYSVFGTTYNGRSITGLATGPSGTQSAVYNDGSNELVFWYANEMAARTIERKPASVLILGGGAFTLPAYLADKLPNASIDVVEIDPELPAIAEKYFYYDRPANVSVVAEDARTYVQTSKKTYDVVLVDVYGDGSIPFSFITKQFGAAVAKRLAPGGVVISNVIAGTTPGPCRELFSAITAAYHGSLPYAVYVSDPNRDVKRTNNIVFFSPTPVSVSGYTTAPSPRTQPYTDDYAPSERLYYDCELSFRR